MLERPLADLYSALDTSERGLTASEATKRLVRYGPNEARPKSKEGLWRDVLGFFANPLVLILLGAAAVAGSVGQVADTIIIGLILTFSLVLNVLQTSRSRKAEAPGCWACIQSAAACALLAAVNIALVSFLSTLSQERR